MPDASPNIVELNGDEIVAVLARNRVGRLAFALHDRVDIQPIHYVYAQGWIYGRTSRGAKLSMLERNRWVAFEVDEVVSLFEWQSVIVHGAVYLMEAGPDDASREAWEHALGLLRRLIPDTMREDDPVPHRDIVFRIAVQESTGRRASVPER